MPSFRAARTRSSIRSAFSQAASPSRTAAATARAGDDRGVLRAAGSDALSRYELGCLLAERGGLDAGALPMASKASVGARARRCGWTRRRANGLLAAKLRGAREFTASSVF
jgi:hypothetical protein